MPNVSHENHLIFMRMTVQVTYIFIPIVSLKDSFCHSGKSKLGIGLFIHELLREPLISVYNYLTGRLFHCNLSLCHPDHLVLSRSYIGRRRKWCESLFSPRSKYLSLESVT